MNTTDRFYNAACHLWEQYYSHPFIKGMGDGSLEISKFRYFMLQDYLYLFEYAKVFAFGVTKAHDHEILRIFSKSIDDILNEEMEIHKSYMARIGISERDILNVKPALNNISYTSYMLAESERGGIADITAAILACSWSYAKIGKYLAEDKKNTEHEFFGQWIDGYAGEVFQSNNIMLMNLMNRLTENISEAEYKRLETIFVNCSKYELEFWNMAWEGEPDNA